MKIEGYTIGKKIAKGGMAEVFLASPDGSPEAQVVVKRIHQHLSYHSEYTTLFRREYELLVKIDHPNIPKVHAYVFDGETPALISEYIEGQTLSRIIKDHRQRQRHIPFRDICHVLEELLETLAYLHELKDENGHSLHFVHRDICPQNIMVTKDGSIKLIDFGSALTDEGMPEGLDGALLGRVSYISPEQAQDPSHIDRRVDLFSTGVLAFELATGHHPFMAEDQNRYFKDPQHCRLPKLSQLRPDLPDGFASFVKKLLAHNPAKRYAKAEEVLDDLALLQILGRG